MLRTFVNEREAAAQSATRGSQLSLECLTPLEECSARSAYVGGREARERTVSMLHLTQAADFEYALRAFVNEREAAAAIAAHGLKLSMECVQPLEACYASSTRDGRQKRFACSFGCELHLPQAADVKHAANFRERAGSSSGDRCA